MSTSTSRPAHKLAVDNLKDEANEKVLMHEASLAGLRDLLFPPESTSSPEARTASPTVINRNGNAPILATGEPPSRTLHGPGIFEVQAATRSLREASLLVVEAAQAWRKAKFSENNSEALVKNEDSRGPGVAARPRQVAHSKGTIPQSGTRSDCNILPTFRWPSFLEVGSRTTNTTTTNRDPDNPEWGGDDHDGEIFAAGSQNVEKAKLRAKNIADGSTAGDVQGGSTLDNAVNYLARMASDTDFVGASGSALVDFFPPDAKLYRNPFVLAHNLDDIIAVYSTNDPHTSGGSRSGVDGSIENVSVGEGALSGKAYLDMRRVVAAAEIIVAEEARERVDTVGTGQERTEAREYAFPSSEDDNGALSDNDTTAPENNANSASLSRSNGFGHEGPHNRSGESKLNNEILFMENKSDKEGEGRFSSDKGTHVEGQPTSIGDLTDIVLCKSRDYPTRKLKRGSRDKLSSDLLAPEHSRDKNRAWSGTFEGRGHQYDIDDKGDRTRALKTSKKPVHRGPWVPLLLDTNVSCLEGFNEVVSEDCVLWQINKSDRIRIGSCKGQVWKVERVAAIENGNGKCLIVLSEPYLHSKANRDQQVSQIETAPEKAQQHLHADANLSTPKTAVPAMAASRSRRKKLAQRRAMASTLHQVASSKAWAYPPSDPRPLNIFQSLPLQPFPTSAPKQNIPISSGNHNQLQITVKPLDRIDKKGRSAGAAAIAVLGTMVTQNTALAASNRLGSPGQPTGSERRSGQAARNVAKHRRIIRRATLSASMASTASTIPTLYERPLSSPAAMGGARRKGNLRQWRTWSGSCVGATKKAFELENYITRNLAVFERNLTGLNTPKGLNGKGASEERRSSYVEGFKADSKALHIYQREQGKPPEPVGFDALYVYEPIEIDNGVKGGLLEDTSIAGGEELHRFSNDTRNSKWMPGAERKSISTDGHVEVAARMVGVGGLIKCQRLWKMVPQATDNRPAWLREYEEGSAAYGSDYQDPDGLAKKAVFFRVPLSWAYLELIVKDRPSIRRFPAFQSKQRVTFFRKLRVQDLIKVAYQYVVAGGEISGVTDGPPTPHRLRSRNRASAGLNIRGWHRLVMALGYIADVTKPTRHHVIDQIYRQRTRQYKAEQRKIGALAARKNAKQNAGDRVLSRRLAAQGDASADRHSKQQLTRLPSLGAGSRANAALSGRKSGSRLPVGLPGGGRRGTDIAVGERNFVRTIEQLALTHVQDQDLRMNVAGFKDALNALVAYKYPHRELDSALKDLVFNYLLVRPELEGIKQMAWLKAKGAAILAEAPMQCAAVRIQAVWRGKRQLWLYRAKQAASLRLQIWVRMEVKRSQYHRKLHQLEALRVAVLQNDASTTIQRLIRQRIWLLRFEEMCCRRRQESLRRWADWRAENRRKRRIREQAIVFRQSRSFNGCMVMITTSRKKTRSLELHVKAYVPITQETFRFDIKEDELQYRLCRALNTDFLSGNEVLANLELVAASLSRRKQINGRRWIVSMTKRVTAEAGTLVYREIRQLDGVIYCFKMYRSSTNVAVTAYEPRQCETLRTTVPIRGSYGLAVWIKWEVETSARNRRMKLIIRLAEAQKILKLHELGVEVPQSKLIAAKRLCQAIAHYKSSVAAAEATADEGKASGAREPGCICVEKMAPVTASLVNIPPLASTAQSAGMHYASNSGESQVSAVYCPDPQLTGLGSLPFAWYDGSVDDLEMFGAEPFETDKVASAPNIDITVRGQEVTLARWILRRLKVERVQVEKMKLPTCADGRGDDVTEDGNMEGAENGRRKPPLGSKKVVKWERVLVTSYEVETKRRNMAASRVQGLFRMKRAREAARAKVFSQFEKFFDADSGAYYYHNSKTGVSTFTKPRVLREDQDLEDPTDDWTQQRDHLGRHSYTNPNTGRRLSVGGGLPGKPRYLGNEVVATLRPPSTTLLCYKRIITISTRRDPCSTLPLRCPPVILLCSTSVDYSCSRAAGPRDETRRKGLKLLNAAYYRDRDLDTFALAEQAFYHFGLFLRPTHSKALLNWALVLEHVRRDAGQAEKFYRSAFAANDLDPQVLANYNIFYLERLPGGAYPGGGPGSRVLRTTGGREVEAEETPEGFYLGSVTVSPA